jgi:hypothetical protein
MPSSNYICRNKEQLSLRGGTTKQSPPITAVSLNLLDTLQERFHDMKKVAVLQSNYIPWKGYFDLIHDADTFIFYDDVQYTKNDWRNRNKIKTPQGTAWLTIPAGYDFTRLIYQVKLTDSAWQAKHWRTICQYYSKAPCFAQYRGYFEHIYMEQQWQSLSELNQTLIIAIAHDFLGINTQFEDSRHYQLTGQKQERLLNLLEKVEATHYISGPAAKDYILAQDFADKGITLSYKNYEGYPAYEQFFLPFRHDVSILDLLFHLGNDAPYYIWGWRSS